MLCTRPLVDNRDTEKLKELYDVYAPALYGVIRLFTVDDITGHAILQSSFITMHREIDTLQTEATVKFSWMLRITLSQIEYVMKISTADIAAKCAISVH